MLSNPDWEMVAVGRHIFGEELAQSLDKLVAVGRQLRLRHVDRKALGKLPAVGRQLFGLAIWYTGLV